MNIAITGADTPIGHELYKRLFGKYHLEKINYNKTTDDDLFRILQSCSIILHLEETKNISNEIDLYNINTKFTQDICDILINTNNYPTIIYLSTADTNEDDIYVLSKKTAEIILQKYGLCTIIYIADKQYHDINNIIDQLILHIKLVTKPTTIFIKG